MGNVASTVHFQVAYAADDQHTSEAASGCLRWELFGLLSYSWVSHMVAPFNIFESARAAHVKGIQSNANPGGQVPCLRAIEQHRGDQGTVHS